MDFALNIVLMGFAEGMTIVYGVLAVIASIMLLWLRSGWIVLTDFQPSTVLDFSVWADGFSCQP